MFTASIGASLLDATSDEEVLALRHGLPNCAPLHRPAPGAE